MEYESLEWDLSARDVCARRMRGRSGIVAAERKSRIKRRPFKRTLLMIPAVEQPFFEHIFVKEKLSNSRVILTRVDLWTPGTDIILSPQISTDYSDIAIDTPTHTHHSTATTAATSTATFGTTTITPVDNNLVVVVDDDDDDEVVVLPRPLRKILPRPPRPQRPPPPPVGLIITPLAAAKPAEKRMCGWPASSKQPWLAPSQPKIRAWKKNE